MSLPLLSLSLLLFASSLRTADQHEREFFKFPREIHLSITNKDTEMRVTWFTKDTPLVSGVWFGEEAGNLNLFSKAVDSNLSDGTGYIHSAVMTDLDFDKTYFYYVGATPEFFSDVHHFHTRQPSDRVTFIAFGDMGTFPRGDTSLFLTLRMRKLLRPEDYPDLVIHAGDFMYPFGNYGMVSTWFDRLQTVGAYVPYMVTSGNRDEARVLERFHMPYSEGPSHPEESRHNYYYSFDYNSVHFVFISTNFDSFQPGSHQYNWLKEDIEQAQKRIQDPASPIHWIVLTGHTPIYSSSNGHDQGNRDLRVAIEAIIQPVTLCLWGDDHVYERSWPMFQTNVDDQSDKGVFKARPSKPIHVTVGTGGIDNDGWAVDQPHWSATRWIGKGYLDIVATRDTFEARFVDRDHSGETIDSFVIFDRDSKSVSLHYILIAVVLLSVIFAAVAYGRGNKRAWGVSV